MIAGKVSVTARMLTKLPHQTKSNWLHFIFC